LAIVVPLEFAVSEARRYRAARMTGKLPRLLCRECDGDSLQSYPALLVFAATFVFTSQDIKGRIIPG